MAMLDLSKGLSEFLREMFPYMHATQIISSLVIDYEDVIELVNGQDRSQPV